MACGHGSYARFHSGSKGYAAISKKLIAKLEAQGAKILISLPRYNTLRVEMSLEALDTIANFPEVIYIQPMQEAMTVFDPETMQPVPWDGEAMGEIMFRGNITMKGYLKNPTATTAAFAGGWFHTGDLAVMQPDGYVKIRDRSKDIIISGGENISSLEVEETLYRHPAVLSAAVVAQPDEKWGETPCAFIELKPEANVSADELRAFCREHMARFKVPKSFVFRELPKTSTGKIQKFVLREMAKSSSAIE